MKYDGHRFTSETPSENGRKEGRESIYDKIGLKGLFKVVIGATPLHLMFTLPYGLVKYRDILRRSTSMEDVRSNHEDTYRNSGTFRMIRPRYRHTERILKEEFEIDGME